MNRKQAEEILETGRKQYTNILELEKYITEKKKAYKQEIYMLEMLLAEWKNELMFSDKKPQEGKDK